MTSRDVVGPLPTIRFHDGTRQAYDVPRDTRDPRSRACTEHHRACDCREAILNEDIGEYRALYRSFEDATERILAGHATYAYSKNHRTGEMVFTGCMCTGCQIARAAHSSAAHSVTYATIDGGGVKER